MKKKSTNWLRWLGINPENAVGGVYLRAVYLRSFYTEGCDD
jgi:hypothetical protein